MYDWKCTCGENNPYKRAICQKCGEWECEQKTKDKLTYTVEKMDNIGEFLKEAFCIDGEVNITFRDINVKNHLCIELNDSERGKFSLVLLTENEI